MSIAHMEVDEVTTVRLGPAAASASWPLYWGAVLVGALSALALMLLFGLTGLIVGAYHIGQRIITWHEFGFLPLAFAVFGSFLSFAAGGWIAAKIAGLRRSEPAMLHGAIVWLVAIPALLIFAALGAGSYFGGWYSGLGGVPLWATAIPLAQQDPAVAVVARNSALGAIAALLLGLMGGVVGGWMGSGEPMTFTHGRSRS